ncbi:MAG TPA: hypothetical protein PK530_09685, partial [Anaerolineales bacterium]|nr:hypothetical protein [Anaerolineales bacterium]
MTALPDPQRSFPHLQKMKLKYFALVWVVFFTLSCRSQAEMRVATTPTITPTILITETKTPNRITPTSTETPTPQIVGNFIVEPVIVKTLPPNGVGIPNTPIGDFASQNASDNPLLTDISIEALANRAYGQDAGTLTFESTLENTGGFTRSLISYPSDGLTIYGFMNIPSGPGPFPVVIFLHGYVNPVLYE